MPARSTLFPYTTLFRSQREACRAPAMPVDQDPEGIPVTGEHSVDDRAVVLVHDPRRPIVAEAPRMVANERKNPPGGRLPFGGAVPWACWRHARASSQMACPHRFESRIARATRIGRGGTFAS